MTKDSLKDLYIDELKDIYSAEKQLTKALPKMAKALDRSGAGVDEGANLIATISLTGKPARKRTISQSQRVA